MKKILLYIVSTLILVACSDEIPEHHQPVRAKRAVLAYMVANNNLDGLIMQNIQWMYESLSTANIIRKSKFPQNPKRSVRFSGKRTKRSVQKRKARNTQKAETKVL